MTTQRFTTPDGYVITVEHAPSPDGAPNVRTTLADKEGTPLFDLPYAEAGQIGQYLQLAGTSGLAPDVEPVSTEQSGPPTD